MSLLDSRICVTVLITTINITYAIDYVLMYNYIYIHYRSFTNVIILDIVFIYYHECQIVHIIVFTYCSEFIDDKLQIDFIVRRRCQIFSCGFILRSSLQLFLIHMTTLVILLSAKLYLHYTS